MTREELQAGLKKMNIPTSAYSLTGKGVEEGSLCLESTDTDWEVYIFERGKKCALRRFQTEHEALDAVYKELCLYKKYVMKQ